jgi:hypothetical protein
MQPDDDIPQADEQPADDQPAEQSDEQPADSDQPTEQSEEQAAADDQTTEPSEEQASDSDQPAEQSEEQPTESDQPAEQSEEQPADSDQPSEQADSDQPASASADNTVAFAGGDAPPGGGGSGGSGGSRPSKDVVVKNERAPADPLPANFVPKGFVTTHRVSDGEDWASVAAKYNIEKVANLIYFNFHTNNPDEVNWYLRRNTGCNVSKDGGRNWAFSSSANPGKIYIPPAELAELE